MYSQANDKARQSQPFPDDSKQAGCCIDGHNYTPNCNPEFRKQCFKNRGCDLLQNVGKALHGLNEAESSKSATSPLFQRVKHVLHCLLGIVPGYGVLLQLFQAVINLRNAARQDARVGMAHIVVRIPGRDDTVPMYFTIVDDALDGQ